MLVALSFSAYSQNYAKVYIWKVSPDTAYQGDTITVDFKFEEPVVQPSIDTTFMQLMNAVGAFSYVWKDKWQNLYSYPRSYTGTPDSTYRVKIKVPVATLPGDCRIYGRGGSFLPFYTKARTATAIKINRSVNDIIEVRYFSLSGAELSEPVAGQKVIRVNFYNDGAFESKLIMVL